jgi:hypothetical protein
VRLEDPGVVDEHVDAAEPSGGVVDHRPHRVGVGEVGSDDDVAGAGQGRRDLLGAGAAAGVVHGDPVAALGERPRDPAVTSTALDAMPRG